jgi:hypothetical protein
MGLTLSKNSVEIDKALATPAVASRTLSQRAESGN